MSPVEAVDKILTLVFVLLAGVTFCFTTFGIVRIYQLRQNALLGINNPFFRTHRNPFRPMLAIPAFPLDAQTQDIVNFCISLASKSPEAFFALYEDNLAIYIRPGTAYEATETTCVQALGHRRFKDRDSFFSAYSNFKTRKADDSQGEKLG